MGTQELKTRIVSGIVGLFVLLTAHAAIGQETKADDRQSKKYDGEALNSQFVAQGVGKRQCIPITRAQISRLLRSPGGAQLAITTKHRWKTTVTLEEFDAGGTKAYSIEGMVAEQGERGVTKASLPMGPGTIYRVIGDVKLLGHTIKADKSSPLIFVVHNVSNSKDADAQMETEGPLASIKFAFADEVNPKPEEPKNVPNAKVVYLQLVHLQGNGSAILERGETVVFGVVPSSAAEGGRQQAEGAAWDSAVKKGTVDAYLIFARQYPKSDRIQIRKGTVRGRYWYKIAMPFGNAQKAASGVLVTVDGTKLLRNVSLKEARAQGLLDIRPATKGREIDANGQTFNWTCLEVTSGATVVGDELIGPKDSKNAMVIISKDGTSLLAWDLKDAERVTHPDDKPTYVKSDANKAWLPEP